MLPIHDPDSLDPDDHVPTAHCPTDGKLRDRRTRTVLTGQCTVD